MVDDCRDDRVTVTTGAWHDGQPPDGTRPAHAPVSLENSLLSRSIFFHPRITIPTTVVRSFCDVTPYTLRPICLRVVRPDLYTQTRLPRFFLLVTSRDKRGDPRIKSDSRPRFTNLWWTVEETSRSYFLKVTYGQSYGGANGTPVIVGT